MKKQLLLLISGIMLFSCANEDDNIKPVGGINLVHT